MKDASVDVAMLSQALHHARSGARGGRGAGRGARGRVLLLDLRAHDESGCAKLGDRLVRRRRAQTDADRRGPTDVKVGVDACKAGDPFTVLIASGTKKVPGIGASIDNKSMTPNLRAQLDAILARRILAPRRDGDDGPAASADRGGLPRHAVHGSPRICEATTTFRS
jgi:hypothetical protein